MRHFGVAVRVVAHSVPHESLPGPVRAVTVDGSVAAEPLVGTYLLGGPLHGWHLPASDDPRGHVDAVVDLVGRTRLRAWNALLRPAPTLEKLHKPGSDSTGVVQFDVDGPLVAKIGPQAVIRSEAAFTREANARLTAAGLPAPFPELRAVELQGHQAVSIMEAAEQVDVGALFTDTARTRLAPDALARFEPHLACLARWYRLTVDPSRPPTVADYLYRERFAALREHPAFRVTLAARLPGADPDTLFAAPVRLPDGSTVPGYTAASRWLDEVATSLLPSWGSVVHGDIYMSNMLHRADGSPVFIDPRTLWDGRDRVDPGYGDPVFDLATLLHGVLPMAAVLEAVVAGRSAELLDVATVDPTAGVLDLSSLTLPMEFSDEVRALERRMLEIPPVTEPEPVVRARLYVGAANSLAGWLKYDRSLRTTESWLATYAFIVWYLDQAKSVLESADLETRS
ncbi:hypothetical protein [Micromonospora sp. NPDC023956]|uniref:hypothetical protein n=1 Tax=Micromonospora sp. NPDC023956 TaxID=3155722 RepID=UPI0033E8887F